MESGVGSFIRPPYRILPPEFNALALLAALCLFLHLPEGFRNRQLRSHVAALLGENLQQYTAAKMSYDLRRLRLKVLINRKAGSTRCYLTPMA
jgi:hypothetical protein